MVGSPIELTPEAEEKISEFFEDVKGIKETLGEIKEELTNMRLKMHSKT